MAEPVTDGNDYALHRQLAVVDIVTPISNSISNSNSSSITPFSSPFSLPDGWLVHRVPRSDGHRFDKYYIEPETGRKFRSSREVKRYLNVEEYKATRSRPLRPSYRIKNSMDLKMITSGANMTQESKWGTSKFTKSITKRLTHREKHLQSCSSRKKIVSSGRMLDFEEDNSNSNQYQLVNITPTTFQSTSSFKLPDGWIVQEVPRKTGDHVDRYYYEPGTGQRFRSLISVQKYISEVDENAPLSSVLEELRENHLPIAKAFKLKKKEQCSSLSSPPMKINWVIGGGENWNAFIENKVVEDSMKQQWSQSFLLTINGSKHNAPISA